MKLLKALTMIGMLFLGSNAVFATDPEPAVGEHQNGCGPNSTCGECVNSDTGVADATAPVLNDDGTPASAVGN